MGKAAGWTIAYPLEVVAGELGLFSEVPQLDEHTNNSEGYQQEESNEGESGQSYDHFLNNGDGNNSGFHNFQMARFSSKRVKRYATRKYGKMRITRGVTMSPELKHFDTGAGVNLAIPATGFWQLLTNGTNAFNCVPQQGTDFSNRIGRKIRVIKVEVNMRFFVTTVGNMPLGGDMLACDIWLDKECKGTSAGPTDVYDSLPMGTPSPASLQNASTLKRFKHLHRQMHDVVPTAVTAGVVAGANVRDFCRVTIPLRKEMNFLTNTGLTADILDNNLLIFVSSVNALAGAAAYGCMPQLRYWYVDI